MPSPHASVTHDTNTNNTDACSNACGTQAPTPDGPPDAGSPDGGAINPESGDGGGCCQTGGPGAAPLLGLLVLGFLVRRRRVR